MRRHRPLALTLSLGLWALGACAAEVSPEGARVAIGVAPLQLSGVTDACYTVRVENGQGAVVWQETGICADDFGDGVGAITYIGPCDASTGASQNTVTLILESLSDGAGPIDRDTYRNPCGDDTLAANDPAYNYDGFGPCRQTFTCAENADTPVEFSVTVLRDASQGFFDVAVDFDDIFCSAKFDTCVGDTPIELLFGDGVRDGEGRDRTGVFGFACTAGPGAGAKTTLYMSDLVVTCPGGITFSLPLAGRETGNQAVAVPGLGGAAPGGGDPLVQYAAYYGAESLTCDDPGTPDVVESCGKRYLNVAVNLEDLPTGCTLSAAATADDGDAPVLGEDGLFERPGTSYPFIALSAVELSACATYALDEEGSKVVTAYHSNLVGGSEPPPMCTVYPRWTPGPSSTPLGIGACANDPVACGDGSCVAPETAASCPADCDPGHYWELGFLGTGYDEWQDDPAPPAPVFATFYEAFPLLGSFRARFGWTDAADATPTGADPTITYSWPLGGAWNFEILGPDGSALVTTSLTSSLTLMVSTDFARERIDLYATGLEVQALAEHPGYGPEIVSADCRFEMTRMATDGALVPSLAVPTDLDLDDADELSFFCDIITPEGGGYYLSFQGEEFLTLTPFVP